MKRTSPKVVKPLGPGLWPPPEERFWARVDVGLDCWEWTGPKRNGYGWFNVAGKFIVVHRFAYELLIGPIDDGLTIDHLCRNRACVNPAHMEPVTSRENTLRGGNPCAVNARKTHCVHGHEFTLENTYLRPMANGHSARQCRACWPLRDQRKRLRAKAAAGG